METPGRRSDYTLLSHLPDDDDDHRHHHQPLQKISAAAGGGAGFDWELVDHRMAQPPARIPAGAFPSSIGLQRQSSGSSFGGSSMSGDYYLPPGDSDVFGHVHDDVFKVSGGGGGEWRLKTAETGGGGGWGSSSSKSWAQQTEESYQLQLALALRLSSDATSGDDPNFLDPVPDELASRSSSSSGSAESMSHRFWVNGCLSYFDRIPDGFYTIHGMDPYVWTVCTDLKENGRIPSIQSLKAVHPRMDSSIEVILIDRCNDPILKELQNRICNISLSCITTKEVVDHLAKIVCHCMGGTASTGEDDFVPIWKKCSNDLEDRLGSVVLRISSLPVGLCRHRALLFKVLADTIDLPCRIAKGCKYCMREDAASCLVRFGVDREYLVDLVGMPGCLSEPDSSLNGPSSVSIASPLRFPRFRQVEPPIDFRSLAKQYFSDCQSLSNIFDEAPTGTALQGDNGEPTYPKQSDRESHVHNSSDSNEIPQLPTPSANAHDRDLQPFNKNNAIISSTDMVNDRVPLEHLQTIGHREIRPHIVMPDRRGNAANNLRFVEGGQLVPIRQRREISLDVEDLDIPWSDLVLKERIGSGSFGTVHRADWHGSDVAVKILMDQDLHPGRLKEFLREVAIMKRLRHPNIVLFMGAVTHPPNLSIVTEYLSRGSLYRLLHKQGAREVLDERRRLSMAYDVAKGMNYLHNRNPPIVHRDLKSPNLLVDKKYTVKVCDFGLSRLKANTFLSSKSAAGTPEWMAPEVLRDEPSNEKSDVYSFGVILWELATLQQPWSGLNPPQVVAAVGFKGKRLEIPRDLNPHVAAIIEACWANDSRKRPSFSSIMDSLRPLIKPPTTQTVHTDMQLHEAV
ncbi:serine/threonine-protein kinase CTR1 isoform X2 [Diospyros lotus]|uniref:serine/threonine-protein kinase CTR1 isoform X2 n=1 Tax=Diospyros lotus TaxID=55363 RepID=UPI00224EA7BA|nr:serine/threonine-protein kinase CTR1 isoform X2 [Diospyros lotus]